MPSILLGVARTTCCSGASSDTHDDYPDTILPSNFRRGAANFTIGDFLRMSAAPPHRHDCWWNGSYRSDALPEDCNGHFSGIPLLLALLHPNTDHCRGEYGSTGSNND